MKIGFIGGSGLYNIESLKNTREMVIDTPFGPAADCFICGTLNEIDVVFLPRHGKAHRLLPHELNHKAHVYAMKKMGVTHLISLSAVGSLRDDIKPRDIVIVDQFYDRTKKTGAEQTYFGSGVVAHVSFAQPTCPILSSFIHDQAKSLNSEDDSDRTIHFNGTYVNIEGPSFSTIAESKAYKAMGFDVVGMTNMLEAKLAREAEMHYSSVSMVTDFDCWHDDHYKSDLSFLLENLASNSTFAQELVNTITKNTADLSEEECSCAQSLETAIITPKEYIPLARITELKAILGRFYDKDATNHCP